MSRGALALLSAGALAILWTGASREPILVWNASASAPIGLYQLRQGPAATGNLVLVHPPPQIAALAAQRHYLPLHVPLIKRLAARVGDSICADQHGIFVDGHYRAAQRDFDSAHRLMPRWTGCRRLHWPTVGPVIGNNDITQAFVNAHECLGSIAQGDDLGSNPKVSA